MQPADGSNPGGVSTSAQTLAGTKTFSSPVLHADGSSSNPGIAFSSETNTGFYRLGSGDLVLMVDGIQVFEWLKVGSIVNFAMGPSGTISGSANTPFQLVSTFAGSQAFEFTNTNTGTTSGTVVSIGNGPSANFTTVENWAYNTANTYLGGGSALFASPNQTQLVIGTESTGGSEFIGFTVGGRTLATERMRLNPTNMTLNGGLSLIMNGSSSGAVSVKTQAAAGTYNFNLPITAGSAGQVLTSSRRIF